jgi:hypothetical protein
MTSFQPTLTITGMSPTVKILPGMNPVEGHDIHFQATNGISGSVFVPTTQQADTDYVKGLIQQRYAELSAIKDITL